MMRCSIAGDIVAPEMLVMRLTMQRLASGQKTRRQRSAANSTFVR